MRNKVEEFVLKNPINFIFLTFLYAVTCAFFPYSSMFNFFNLNGEICVVITVIIKAILSIFPLIIIIYCTSHYYKNDNKYSKLPIILAFIVCINNFPFFSLFTKSVVLEANFTVWLLHILSSISVSLFEELIFRGVIFAIIFKITTTNRVLKSVVYSSTMFALVHILNLFAGEAVWYVLFQISYSFLMGCLFAFALLISKNILVPIALHAIYNFGGLLEDFGILSGTVWSIMQVIITTIIALAIGCFMIFYILKINRLENNDESGSSTSV